MAAQQLPRLALHLSNHGSARDVVDLAVRAERAGIEQVWLSEDLFYRSATATAAAVLAATSRISVAFGVLVPQTRHPAALAMEVRTLTDLGPGRVQLGLGAGVAQRLALVGKDTGKPLTVVREAVEAVRTLLSGGTLDQDGLVHTSAGLALTGELTGEAPPVHVAAVGPRALEQAGRDADGVLLTLMCAVEHARWACDRVAAGAADAGRTPPPVALYAPVFLDGRVDGSGDARLRMRRLVAQYAARWADLEVLSTLFTRWSSLDEAAVRAIRDDVRSGGDGAALVPDEVIDSYGASGSPQQCREVLAAYAGAGVATLAVDGGDADGTAALVERWGELTGE